ncbi:ABC transporter permease [Microbacterium sp. NEAU-LLC]|uniref:ABC transporter permease n=1 Tax=Microbacterium helvum TaxID=2773713 RepID=A0ABR8NPT2_9MICO|nr:ABC transporter permease [Microbacterium helvum]MBD3942194.1 ABC transporter permease [Microbacterium helvum]
MTRRVTTRALVAHHLRSRAGGSGIVAALVLVLTVLATAAPIALGIVADAALRDRLDALPATARDVVSQNPGGFPQLPSELTRGNSAGPFTTEEVWGPFESAVESIRAGADAPLPDVLGAARMVTTNTDNPVMDAAAEQAVTVAYDPDYEREVEIVEGRMPAAAPAYEPPPSTPVGEDEPVLLSRIEVVLSQDTAAEMEWEVGQTRTVGTRQQPVELVLVGLFAPVDPDGAYWQYATSVLTPKIFDDGNRPRKVTGTAYAHPASLVAQGLIGRYSTLVWYPTDTDGIDGGNAEQTVAALNKLTAVSHPISSSSDGIGILSVSFDADITGEIELAVAQQRSTAAVLVMLVAGPVGVAVAVLVLGCRLILEGRRPSLRLLSARGASTGQLRGLLAIEGAIAGAVPAIVGAIAVTVAGGLLFGATPTALGIVAALLLALAPIVILIVLAPSAAERQTRADLGARGSRLRLIVEGVIAGLAAVALALLFIRGYSDGVDLLIAATPLLLALVACLVTLRAYPLPLRAVLARARASAGSDAFLGAARALREPSIGLTPVLALVVGVSVAVSSGILLSALQSGIADSAQAQVGGDVRITGGTFTREQLDQLGGVEGVAAATGISGADPATIDIDGVKRATSVYVVDAAELSAVQGDGLGMLPPGVSLEPADGRMPIVVAGATADMIGDTEKIDVGGVDAVVVGVTRGPVPTGVRENWVALDSTYAEDVLGRDPSDRTVLVRLDEGVVLADVRDDLTAVLGDAVTFATPGQIAADIQSGPAVQGVRWALLAATAIAALLSALAIVMTLALAAGPRARVLALLRTLGAPRRAATSLALWEIGPPAVAAVVAGTLFGLVVPLVVLAAVDLRPFTGSSVAPAYQVDPGILLLTLGGFLALAVLLTAIALFVSRRIRAAGALRTVEEG